MPRQGNVSPLSPARPPTIIRSGPTLDDVWPDDWVWCGACGAPNRRLTEAEALMALSAIAEAGAAVSRGDRSSALEVLDVISWPMEMHARARSVTCTCCPCGRPQ